MSKLTETLVRAWFISMFATILVGPFMSIAQEHHALGVVVEGLFFTLFFIGDIALGVLMMVTVYVDTAKITKSNKKLIAELDARR